jgi:hypothetical protein
MSDRGYGDRWWQPTPADLEKTNADAAKAANTKTADAFTVTKSGLNVVMNGKYQFSFAYLYSDPNNDSNLITGSRSPNFVVTLQAPDLTQPVTNLVVTPGLLSYTAKWDLIDKLLPANKWLIDIQIYESLTGAFAGEEYLVWNGNGSSATILVSNTANRWIRVDTRDQDFRKKSVTYGPFKATDPIVVDTVGPDNVTSVNSSDSGIDTSGYLGFNAYANISWPAVTGGGIRGYRIRFSNDNNATYSYVDSPGTGTTYKLTGLAIGSTYKIAVATYDEYNNTSSSYVSGSDVTVNGTPSVSNFITGGPFQFGVGVGSVSTNKGLYFDASNYWYVNATNSARLKVGGASSNYLLWDGSTFAVDGNITARGGVFSGNIFMSSAGASIYNGTIDATTGNLTGNGFALNSTGLKVANGVNSVTIAAATGTITANAGSIGGWNLSGTTLSKNNIILDSTGQIQVGSTAAQSVYLKSSGGFLMWAGNNTPDANAKFRVAADGTLYATGAVFAGYATSDSVNGILSSAATDATTKANAAQTAAINAAAGDATTKAQAAQNAAILASVSKGDFNKEAIIAKINNSTNTTTIEGGIIKTGTISADAVVTNFISSFEIAASKITVGTLSGHRLTAGALNTSYYLDTKGNKAGIDSLVVNAIGIESSATGGVTTHWYPYMPGSPNIDLGLPNFRWNDVRSSGRVYMGHGGSDTITNVTGQQPYSVFLNTGRIYANTLGTGSGTGLVQDSNGYIRVSSSSRRYKENISEIESTGYLDAIKLLKPVKFSYKLQEADIDETPGYETVRPIITGLIAEDVEQIDKLKDFVNYNALGETEGLAYDRLTTALTLAIQELAEKLDVTNTRLDALEG